MIKIAAGVLLLISGAVWILQGLNIAFAPQSFMTGNRFWTVAGVASVVVGAGLIWWGVRNERPKR